MIKDMKLLKIGNDMKIQIEEIKSKQFGHCIKMTKEDLELIASLDFGPRIVSLKKDGHENLFFEDPERHIREENESLKDYYGKAAVWHSYGGHRLWIAPESMPETYYPDNFPVKFQIGEHSVTLIQEPQEENGIQLSMEIIMEEASSKIKIEHRVKNISDGEKTLALWAVSVMRPGGEEYIPLPQGKKGLCPNVSLALWPYTDLCDERFVWQKECIRIRQEKINTKSGKNVLPFKIGINNQAGWASYTNKKVVFTKKYNHNPQGNYPDFGVSYETYTNAYFLEMESLGELKTIKPMEEVLHSEIWEVTIL